MTPAVQAASRPQASGVARRYTQPGALERLPRRWTLTESAGGRVALEAT